ncbi:uncharacterized protein MKK02DRAFT_38837 [Dioszegia hungarica]|uniref:Uncharacterized protein n=1 Tax=Dioszegia hungarica TaxID=4972 RepID=A0AA38H575_9TREE|nr:uncharacterized protein MKK02DRAFT_38837 [Dioszegia hungarica]KAI9634165.1 hypothetical protein MKK02DRAFT_38837 [Dioszegia hungarica]
MVSLRTIAALKAQLLPALKPLSADLPFPPSSAADIKLFEERTVEGAEGMRDLEDDEAGSGGSIQSLGWKRWKRVFVSFKGENGLFEEPVYTIPDVDDEMPEGAEGM